MVTAVDQLAEVEAGDVLVVPNASGAWSAALRHAAAVVMETGGTLAAGARMARAHGIPVLVAVPDATRLLRRGEVVEIDGDRGTLTRRS